MNIPNGRSLLAVDNEQRLPLHKLCHSATDAPGLPSFQNFTGSTHNALPMDTTPAQHPTTPNIMRPSPLDHRPDLTGRTDRWRRDSLPSIAHLTGRDSSLPGSPDTSSAQANIFNQNGSSSKESVVEPMRRHSIPSMLHVDEQRRKSETPYSRTPELRESHKLAERRRRKEMKELFDDLMNVLPVEKGAKTSKWEILSKGMSCLLRARLPILDYALIGILIFFLLIAVDYIGDLHKRQEIFAREKELLLRDRANLKKGASSTKTGWD
ncbi:hypothetical protein BX666DRAFT_343228 [Dichotomocladium elegans]|nr:hypothetical protein BX666DRAFT_343228 [Dichotomocladium elegans]